MLLNVRDAMWYDTKIPIMLFKCINGEQNAHLNTMKHSTGLRCVIWQNKRSPFLSWLVHIHWTVNNPSKQLHFRQVCSPCNTRVKEGAFESRSCFSDPGSLIIFSVFPKEDLCMRSSPEQIFFSQIFKDMSRGFFFFLMKCLKKKKNQE